MTSGKLKHLDDGYMLEALSWSLRAYLCLQHPRQGKSLDGSQWLPERLYGQINDPWKN